MTKLLLLKEVSQIDITKDMLNEFAQRKRDGLPIIVTGVIQRADVKNQNNRIYPYNVLRPKIDKYIEENVAKGVALGELDHRDSPIVELKNVSHVIDEIFWGGNDNKDVLGKIRLLPTPSGRIAEEIVMAGIPLGISSRAVGSLSKNEAQGVDVVESDLELCCFDLVSHPSTDNAYLRMFEAKEIKNFNPSKVLPSEIRIKQTLQKLLKK